MTSREVLESVPGGPELIAWFGGHVPHFHDAEVLGVMLDREDARCVIRIHGFQMTSETDAGGYFICRDHAVATFDLKNVSAIELSDFNHQNALMGLRIDRTDDGQFSLDLDPAHGLGGTITAYSLEITLTPGIPPGSQYLEAAARQAAN